MDEKLTNDKDEKFSEKEKNYGEAGSLGEKANENTKVNSGSETNENSKVKSGSETNAGRGSETDNVSNQSSSSNRTEYFYLGKLGKITNFRLAMFIFGGFTMIAGVNIFATSLFHILDSVEELIFSLILLGFSSIFLFAAFLPVLPLNTQIKEKIKEFIENFIDYSVLYGSDEDENEPVENSNENEGLVSINLSDSSEENLVSINIDDSAEEKYVSINIDDSAEEKYVSINIDQSAGGNLVSKNLDESSGENQDSKKESVEELIGILRKAQESKAETSINTNDIKEEIIESSTNKIVEKVTETSEAEITKFTMRDCLKQQTTHYSSEEPFLMGIGEGNALFLLHYHDKAFFLYKVAVIDGGKLVVIYDYRKSGMSFVTAFNCEYEKNGMKIHVQTATGDEADFEIRRKVELKGNGFRISHDQEKEFAGFSNNVPAYIEWAYKNTEFKEQQENKLSDKELKEFVKNLDPEVIAQFALPAKNGKKEEAIKECVRLTGLGLENCKRIMDLKMYYF